MAGEPSPALSSSGRAGPPQAALRHLPSASPTNRPHRATSAGMSEEGEEVVHHRESSSGPEAHEPARDRGSSSGPEAHEPAIAKRDPFRKRAPTRHTTSLHTTSLATRLLSAFSFSARVPPQPTPTLALAFRLSRPRPRVSPQPNRTLAFLLSRPLIPALAFLLSRPPNSRSRSASCRAGLRPSLRPVFGSASLRASARSLSKGGVPSRSPLSAPCGGRGKSVLAQVQEIIPPKSDPSLT